MPYIRTEKVKQISNLPKSQPLFIPNHPYRLRRSVLTTTSLFCKHTSKFWKGKAPPTSIYFAHFRPACFNSKKRVISRPTCASIPDSGPSTVPLRVATSPLSPRATYRPTSWSILARNLMFANIVGKGTKEAAASKSILGPIQMRSHLNAPFATRGSPKTATWRPICEFTQGSSPTCASLRGAVNHSRPKAIWWTIEKNTRIIHCTNAQYATRNF